MKSIVIISVYREKYVFHMIPNMCHISEFLSKKSFIYILPLYSHGCKDSTTGNSTKSIHPRFSIENFFGRNLSNMTHFLTKEKNGLVWTAFVR